MVPPVGAGGGVAASGRRRPATEHTDMPRTPSDLTGEDMFCGAGGQSEALRLLGVRLLRALNHWPRAIITHNTNFPDAEHICADVYSTDPSRFPISPHVLVAGPECTNHSQAKTRKAQVTLLDPTGLAYAERSRATMMDVPRFAEYHRYQLVLVENVVEVTRWAGFSPWLTYMHNLGYHHRLISLNSMVAHPVPQSRDRLYVLFWRRGNRAPELEFTARAHCPACSADVDALQSWRRPDVQVGKFRQQYDYRCPRCSGLTLPYAFPALAALDLSLPMPRFGDRRRAAATRRRVEVGHQRLGGPVTPDERPWDGGPLTLPPPRTHGQSPHAGAIAAWLQRHLCAQSPHSPGTAQGELPFDADETGAGVPFIAELRGGGSTARSLAEPLTTLCASGNHHAVCVPAFYVKNYGDESAAGPMAHHLAEPFGTITTTDHHAIVGLPFLTSYYGASGTTPGAGLSSVEEPMGTLTTHDRHALVRPGLDVDDCGLRMMKPHEKQAAMGFRPDYVITGTETEQGRQLGLAVTPPAPAMILERALATLA